MFSTSPAFAQKKYTISGIVRDPETKESLVGVAVYSPELQTGTNTSNTGYYQLTVAPGTYTLQFSYVGYQSQTHTLTVTKNLKLNLDLMATSHELNEVVIEAGGLQEKLKTSQMSVEQLSIREAKLMPALFGEVDIIKSLQLKPGVQSGGEGSAGLYVRGGGPDQNLFLLDGATIYNASHLFGFFSVFNSDAVRSVDLYKGGFPAQFGGRLSSVVDVSLKEGNTQKYSASGGVGLIASRLTLEGPIKKGKSSFIISGRRTYVDLFTRLMNQANAKDPEYDPIPNYYFYDFNAKAHYDISAKDKVYLSGYLGNDLIGFRNSGFNFDFNWGNKAGALRWQHNFSPKLFLNTTLSASGYRYNITNTIENFSFNISSNIKDYGLRTDLDYLPGNNHSFKFGAQAVHHAFEVGRLKAGSEDNTISFSSGSTYQGVEYGVYAGDEYTPSPSFTLNYGLRFSGFKAGTSNFMGLEPRVAARYALTENTSLKASYTRMNQYIHLVSNSGASLPTDIWYPANNVVRPQRSHQVALGISKLSQNGQYLLTNEVYYKWMLNQIDFKDGAQLFANDNLNAEFLFGRGRSYGNEWYLEKKQGRTTGWIGYTLSWTYRQFAEINEGRWFPNRYDRRHDVTLVALHQLTKRLHFTGTWVYGSGNAFSVPVARIILQGHPGERESYVPIYSERNSYRQAPYHRLDLGIVYRLRPKRGEADLTFSLYNAYNRRNPYFIYFKQIRDEETEVTTGFQAKQVSLFPAIPAITYNFKF
ncbi:TonB-dependent receptor [Adhaeribacter aquaticus]|uniref:TonB-dependent receptor n=1 Tax=Adhaeribacter aquaticus TaxID=299567 RepID=UPI001FE1FA1C|nr:TonB-dependent receptor [Adhaeribacter aquaticus]